MIEWAIASQGSLASASGFGIYSRHVLDLLTECFGLPPTRVLDGAAPSGLPKGVMVVANRLDAMPQALRSAARGSRIMYVAHNVEHLASGPGEVPEVDGRVRRVGLTVRAAATRIQEARALGRADAIVGISHWDLTQLARMAGSAMPRSTAIYPPVPPARAGDKGGGATGRVVYSGSFTWWRKRRSLSWLISEVWPRVESARPSAQLVVGGPNAMSARPPMGWSGNSVVFSPQFPEYREGDIAVIPEPQRSGVKLKAVEAFAAGVPVVAFPNVWDSIGYFLGNESNIGWQLRSSGGLADQVVHLLSSRSKYEASAALSRRLAERMRQYALRDSERIRDIVAQTIGKW